MIRMDPQLRRKIKALLFGIEQHRRAQREAVDRREMTGTPLLEDKFDYASHNAEIAKLRKELVDLTDPFDGNGLQPGRLVHFYVADGSAEYIVGNIGNVTTEMFWIPGEYDNYESDAVWQGKILTGKVKEYVEGKDDFDRRTERLYQNRDGM